MKSALDARTFGVFARPENREAVNRIEAAGNFLLNLPSAMDEPVSLDAESLMIIGDAESFDWVVFTDCYAADRFLKMAEEIRTESVQLDDVSICSVGEATARKLGAGFVHSDVITQTVDPISVFMAISDFAGGIAEMRILCVTGEQTAFNMPEAISSQARLRIVSVYRLRFDEGVNIPKIRALLLGGSVDALLITSAEDVESLKALIGRRMLAEALCGVGIYAINNNAYQALAEHGCRPRYFTDN